MNPNIDKTSMLGDANSISFCFTIKGVIFHTIGPYKINMNGPGDKDAEIKKIRKEKNIDIIMDSIEIGFMHGISYFYIPVGSEQPTTQKN